MTAKFHIECYSKGLYSNWFWHAPSRTLFDCGEGVASYLGNYAFGIERICISHACHADHIGGLAMLIGVRNSARGDKKKPLDIYYPADDFAMADYKRFIDARFKNWLTFTINWHPIDIHHKIVIDKTHWIETFKLSHTKRSSTLGYKIIEERSRLKKEFRGKNIPEILKTGAVKSAELNENYDAITLAYCLDAFKLDTNDIANAEMAIMDCSFLDKSHRDENTHCTIDESILIAREAKVKTVFAAHLSSRYGPLEWNSAEKDFCIGSCQPIVKLIRPNIVHSL